MHPSAMLDLQWTSLKSRKASGRLRPSITRLCPTRQSMTFAVELDVSKYKPSNTSVHSRSLKLKECRNIFFTLPTLTILELGLEAGTPSQTCSSAPAAVA